LDKSGRAAGIALSHEEHEGSEEREGASSEAKLPLVSFAFFVFFV
jgi:hypothetical protein